MMTLFNLLKCRAWAYSWVCGWTILAMVYSHVWGNGNIKAVVATFALCCLVCAIASAAPAPRAAQGAVPTFGPAPSMAEDRQAAKYGGLPVSDYLERWGEKDAETALQAPVPSRKNRLFYPPPAAPPCVEQAASRRRLEGIQERNRSQVVDALSRYLGKSVRRISVPSDGAYTVVSMGSRPGMLRLRRIGPGMSVWEAEAAMNDVEVCDPSWAPRASGEGKFKMPEYYPMFPHIGHNPSVLYGPPGACAPNGGGPISLENPRP